MPQRKGRVAVSQVMEACPFGRPAGPVSGYPAARPVPWLYDGSSNTVKPIMLASIIFSVFTYTTF